MWAICAFFNPVLTVLSVVILRIPDLGPDQLNDILSRLGLVAGGEWLQKLVAADACLVLAGSPLGSLFPIRMLNCNDSMRTNGSADRALS